MQPYNHFTIYDPKVRRISALHYIDRIVQHCLCDNCIGPFMEKHLVYDNAARRSGKGTHFAIGRLEEFMRRQFKQYGKNGYFLKCDIEKYFDNIDHEILKKKIIRYFKEEKLLWILDMIIDSYSVKPGKGLPLGNQTSQWFAMFYLDELDRFVKENCRIKFYTRYMDDFILIHYDKKVLQRIKSDMEVLLGDNLELSFNRKTQIIAIKNGVEYLEWRFYFTDTRNVTFKEIGEIIYSYKGHMMHENTWRMREKILSRVWFWHILNIKEDEEC